MLHLNRPSLLGYGLLVAVALAMGCSTPTAPEPLGVSLEVVALASEQERQSWPFAPAISGNRAIQIQGTAEAGCGYLRAEATRRANVVAVTIVSEGADRPCVAITPAWRPFRAAITVPPGEYEVLVDAVGHDEVAHAAVSVR